MDDNNNFLYDSLTGLPDRSSFCKDVKELVLKDFSNMHYYLVDIDIDGFRGINKKYGWEKGDKVLKQIAIFIKNELSANERVSRLDADHFIMLIHEKNDEAAKNRVLKNNSFLSVMMPNFSLIFSYGIYRIDNKDEYFEQMYDKAHLARKSIKHRKDITVAMFEEKMDTDLIAESNLRIDMHDALLNNDFKVYYQPRYNSDNEKIVGAEALVRWVKPDGTIILPDKFIPVFEKDGTINLLDWYILEQVCINLQHRLSNNLYCIPVSVNFSGTHNFYDSFVNKICLISKKYNIPAHYLELEISENIMTHNFDAVKSCFSQLHEKGYKISINAFGKVYSISKSLIDFPIDAVKISSDFLQYGNIDIKQKNLLRLLFTYFKNENIPTVIGGVENKNQLKTVKNLGVDIIQGDHYCKPLDTDSYSNLLNKEGKKQKSNTKIKKISDKKKHTHTFKLKHFNRVIVITAIILLTSICINCFFLFKIAHRNTELQKIYKQHSNYLLQIEKSSNLLMYEALTFAQSQNRQSLEKYFSEFEKKQHEEISFKEYIDKNHSAYLDDNMLLTLRHILTSLNELSYYELHAVRLVSEGLKYDMEAVPKELKNHSLSYEEQRLTDDEKIQLANRYLLNDSYSNLKNRFDEDINSLIIAASDKLIDQQNTSSETFFEYLNLFFVLILIFLFAFITWLERYHIYQPLKNYKSQIENREKLPRNDVQEIDELVQAINIELYETKKKNKPFNYIINHTLTLVFEYDIQNNIVTIYHESQNNFLKEQIEKEGCDNFLNWVHPDEKILAERKFKELLFDGGMLSVNIRLGNKNGVYHKHYILASILQEDIENRKLLVSMVDLNKTSYEDCILKSENSIQLNEKSEKISELSQKLLKTNDELNLTELRYKIALEHTNVLIVEYNMNEKRAYPISSNNERFDLIPTCGYFTFNSFSSLIYPDDTGKELTLKDYVLNDCKRKTIRLRMHTQHNKSHYRWYEITGTPLLNKCREIISIVITISDIHDEIKIEQEKDELQQSLDAQSEIMNILHQSFYDLFFDYDAEKDIMKYTKIRHDGKPMIIVNEKYLADGIASSRVHPDDQAKFIFILLKILKDGAKQVCEYRGKYYNSEYRWYRAYFISVKDANGKINRVVGRMDDIDDEKHYHEKSEHDEMTTLYNRRTFIEKLNQYLDNNEKGAFIIFDIDEFKEINDTYGHQAGDDILMRFSEALQKNFRNTDICGRLGGDEFIVWANGISERNIAYKMKKISKYLEHSINVISEITFSAGISFSKHNDTFDILYKNADKALYDAKGCGKNCFKVFKQD